MRVVVRSEGRFIAGFTAKTKKGLNKQQKADLKKLRSIPRGFGLWSETFQRMWLRDNGLEHLWEKTS